MVLSFSINASARHVKDTIRFNKSVVEQHHFKLPDSSKLAQIGLDSILNKIEKVHNTLYNIINTAGVSFNTEEIEANLPEVDSNVEIVDQNLELYNNVIDVKNLQMFDVLLSNLQHQLSDWKSQLSKYEKELVVMSDEMGEFRKDTLLRAIISDTSFKMEYPNEIADLVSKWRMAKKDISDNLSHIHKLQSRVSNEYFTTIDLQHTSKGLLDKVNGKSLDKEYPYLWDAQKEAIHDSTHTEKYAKRSYREHRKILRYYFKRNFNDQLWLIGAALLFFIWVFRDFRKLEKNKDHQNIKVPSFHLINKVPILAMLVVMFNIAPLFDLHPPTAYIAFTGWLLVLSVTVMLRRVWPKRLFYYWLVITALYIVSSVTGPILTPAFGFRVFLLSFNIVSFLFGIIWFRATKKNMLAFALMIRVVSVIYCVFNLAAIACNLLGRLSLAKIFSVTATHGLMQIVCLSVFIEIVMELFALQTIINKLKGGISAKFNFEKIRKLLKNVAMTLSGIIWIIVFTISLNIYNFLYDWTFEFLTKERKIGSTGFEIGNILLFIAIIYISNLLQHGVGSLYGKENDNWDPEVKKNGSRLAMTRLVLIVIGFLVAVAASGIPMDRITIVLGALGVGIGLGLQSIVNNLVSGVILIFEQPFRIGDFIELGDKKGRVLDIGIRSSKIVMDEGAEIIMPNADLLSGRVVNWTLRDDDMRIDMPLSIVPGRTFDEIKDIIIAELGKHKNISRKAPPGIYLSALSDKSMTVNVQVWINNVHTLQATKSELLNSILDALAQNGIKVV